MRETPEQLKALIDRAYKDINSAAILAEQDPKRPMYHFRSPSQWMDDPNGGLWHNGYYHMFYCWNPNSYAQRAGMVYKTAERVWDPDSEDWTGGIGVWGHARSKDLIHWEHLPIAIFPQIEKGEHFIWFGCVRVNKRGLRMAFYTAVGPDRRPEDTADQWVALGDKDLINWQPYENNPVLTYSLNGDTRLGEWRDPFIFEENGKTYLILGGTRLPKDENGHPAISLYEALDDELTKWKFKGILFEYADVKTPSIECPNIARFGDKWVIFISPHKEVEYFVGTADLENCTFTVEAHDYYDFSNQFYATNILTEESGRKIMWGSIVDTFKGSVGWQCCLSLPRILELDEKNDVLLQKPAPELETLRAEKYSYALDLAGQKYTLCQIKGGTFEIEAWIDGKDGNGLELVCGSYRMGVEFCGGKLHVADVWMPVRSTADGRHHIRVYIDKMITDVYVDGVDCCTRIIEPVYEATDINVFGTGACKVDVYQLNAENLFSLSKEYLQASAE